MRRWQSSGSWVADHRLRVAMAGPCESLYLEHQSGGYEVAFWIHCFRFVVLQFLVGFLLFMYYLFCLVMVLLSWSHCVVPIPPLDVVAQRNCCSCIGVSVLDGGRGLAAAPGLSTCVWTCCPTSAWFSSRRSTTLAPCSGSLSSLVFSFWQSTWTQ